LRLWKIDRHQQEIKVEVTPDDCGGTQRGARLWAQALDALPDHRPRARGP
jgi:hypothetical protein